jgi:hypothetical protein
MISPIGIQFTLLALAYLVKARPNGICYRPIPYHAVSFATGCRDTQQIDEILVKRNIHVLANFRDECMHFSSSLWLALQAFAMEPCHTSMAVPLLISVWVVSFATYLT